MMNHGDDDDDDEDEDEDDDDDEWCDEHEVHWERIKGRVVGRCPA